MPICFSDIDTSDWFYDAVLWAAENGITTGTDEKHFSPYGICSRAQMITFLWRAAGSRFVNYAMSFTDVEADTWYTEAVRWAASGHITNGTGPTAFSPDAEITREQLATLICNYARINGADFSGVRTFPLEFDDAEEVSSWADGPMRWCVMNGIVKGVGKKMLAPKNTANRAETVTMLYRYFHSL